jgi:hypothetical protein
MLRAHHLRFIEHTYRHIWSGIPAGAVIGAIWADWYAVGCVYV